MPNSARPRNPPGGVITPRMQTYLAALPGHKGGVTAACQAIGLRTKTLTKWRGWSQAFREEEARIRHEIAEEQGELGRLRAFARNAIQTQPAAIGAALDPPWKQLFLLVYQREHDRITACKAAEQPWSAVKAAVEADKAFAGLVAEVEEEMDIQLHDAQRRRAIRTGEAAAANAYRKTGGKEPKPAGPVESLRERVQRLKAEKGAVN